MIHWIKLNHRVLQLVATLLLCILSVAFLATTTENIEISTAIAVLTVAVLSYFYTLYQIWKIAEKF